MELILLYLGKGKGKTCACVGQAVRALGSGLKVAFGQFMKRPGKAGEQLVLERLLGEDFFAAGAGFFHSESQRAVQRAKVEKVLEWASQRKADLLVLDEALNALTHGLLEMGELDPFIQTGQGLDRHLVLSGRQAPAWLLEKADTITEMLPLAHPFSKGLGAICGIEY